MNLFSKLKKVEKLSPQLRSLYLHRVIKDIGLEVIGIFGAIFLYKVTGSLKSVLAVYFLVSLIYFLLLPFWAKLLRFFNLHILMAFGTILLLGNIIVLYFLSPDLSFWSKTILIFVLIFFEVAHRLFYWTPYHVDLARFMNIHHRGRQLSSLAILISLICVALPAFGAFVIVKFGFPVLFMIAGILVLISIFPIFFLSSAKEKYQFGYFESFKKIFTKKHIKSNLAYFSNGFQNIVSQIIWPIFIFLILQGKYIEIGLISAGIILVVCVLRYIIGEATDRFDKKKLIKAGSILYAFGWIFKFFASSALPIFLVGIYHDFTAVVVYTPFDALMYEIAADQGHFIDEFTILREMSLHLGRVFMCLIGIIILPFIGIGFMFIFTAVISLLLNLISKEEFAVVR
jgi:YQGE family putative transporter